MTDLTDRFNEICDNMEKPSIEEQWEENPEPEVGQPSGQTIFEQAGSSSYVWNSANYNEIIRFSGETIDIKR